MKQYLEKKRKAVGVTGSVICFAIAVVYLTFIPGEASTASGIHAVILIYGHSAYWTLLGVASILWAITRSKWSARLAYAALCMYIIFICTLLTTKLL